MEEESPGFAPDRRRFLGLGLAAAAVAALPTRADASTFLRIRSLLGGEPLSGARVRVGGRELVADASGQVPADGLFAWSPVEIVADGHITRRTCLRDAGEIRLFPRDGHEALRELVYGEGRLLRPVGATIDVVPHGAIAAHGTCARTLSGATARAASDLQVGFRIVGAEQAVEASVTRPRVDILVDPDDVLVSNGARAVFYRRTHGATVIGGRIVLSSCEVAHDERTLLHELGHLMLGHSPLPGDLMRANAVDTPADGFSAGERALLALVRDRQPGNLPEDDDSELGPRPALVALGQLVHQVVYAPGLTADSVFAPVRPRMASARRQSLVCCA